MTCDFQDANCGALSSFFKCKKCARCGYVISLPAQFADNNWGAVLTSFQHPCADTSNFVNFVTPVTAPVASFNLPPAEPVTDQIAPPEPPPVSPTVPDLAAQALESSTGPGGFLKKMLSKIGINAAPNCSCTARAKHMDQMGNDWCEQNLDVIVSWLKEEAEKRRLPFVDWGARLLVKRAIKLSRRAETEQLKTANKQ